MEATQIFINIRVNNVNNLSTVHTVENIMGVKQGLISQIKMLSESSQIHTNTYVMIPFI